MKNYIRNYRWIVVIMALILAIMACNLANQAGEQPPREPSPGEGEPPEGESAPEEQPPSDEEHPEEVWIEFEAERTHLAPGECTLLFWNTEGGFGIFLNGEPVERSGEREVCQADMFVLGVDTGEEMEERTIEIVMEGETGEEHGDEEPPQEEQPEPEEPEEEPPPEPEMNDEEAIKQALLAELGANESEMDITFGRMDENFAEGGVNDANAQAGGAQWLAAKENGQWVIVHHGQDLPPCDAVDGYNVPPDWVAYCWDEASGTSVER